LTGLTIALIFGGNGFIGSHLAERLVHDGFEVKIFDTFNTGIHNLDSIINDIEIVRGDFLDKDDLSRALKNVELVFHYISTTNPVTAVNNPVFDVESNIIGSIRLFQAAIENKIERVIFPSSGGTIYGPVQGDLIKETHPLNPVNPYAISKLTIEKYLHYFNYSFGMDYFILRYSNPYGERQNPRGNQGVIPIFLNKIKNKEHPVIYGDGSAIRDYIYIDDAIDATMAVLNSNTDETLFNVGSGQETSINQLISVMSDVTSSTVDPVFLENSGIYLPKIVLDISRIRKETGWYPKTDIKEGIKKTWEWINKI
jgi:UDP-glucose 4-epimerase